MSAPGKAADGPLFIGFGGKLPMLEMTSWQQRIHDVSPELYRRKFTAAERESLARYGRVHRENGTVWVDMVHAAQVLGRR